MGKKREKKPAEFTLIGRKPWRILMMTPTVLRETGWTEPGPMIILDDGTLVFAGADAEGNQSGRLFGNVGDHGFRVIPDRDLEALLASKQIKLVRKMTPGEIAREGWGHEPPGLVLDLGSVTIFPSRDDEGNGPGVLYIRRSDGSSFFAKEEGPKEWKPGS